VELSGEIDRQEGSDQGDRQSQRSKTQTDCLQRLLVGHAGPSGSLHENVGQATNNDDRRDGPKQDDWHGCSPLVAASGEKLAAASSGSSEQKGSSRSQKDLLACFDPGVAGFD
jgi:hypothetical protein